MYVHTCVNVWIAMACCAIVRSNSSVISLTYGHLRHRSLLFFPSTSQDSCPATFQGLSCLRLWRSAGITDTVGYRCYISDSYMGSRDSNLGSHAWVASTNPLNYPSRCPNLHLHYCAKTLTPSNLERKVYFVLLSRL